MSLKIDFTLDEGTIDKINAYSELLKQTPSQLLNEALNDYFIKLNKELLEKSATEENSQTNLDFNEFWDDFEL